MNSDTCPKCLPGHILVSWSNYQKRTLTLRDRTTRSPSAESEDEHGWVTDSGVRLSSNDESLRTELVRILIASESCIQALGSTLSGERLCIGDVRSPCIRKDHGALGYEMTVRLVIHCEAVCDSHWNHPMPS